MGGYMMLWKGWEIIRYIGDWEIKIKPQFYSQKKHNVG